jgi:hypothetical protein
VTKGLSSITQLLLLIAKCPLNFSVLFFDFCFAQKIFLETQVVRRCKALQAAAWQRHARFEATPQMRSNCVFQDYL